MLATLCSNLIATKAGSDRCIPGTLRRNSVGLPPPGKIVGLHDIPVKAGVRADQAVATGHNGLFVTGEHRRRRRRSGSPSERDTPNGRATRSEPELRTQDKIKRRAALDKYTSEHSQRSGRTSRRLAGDTCFFDPFGNLAAYRRPAGCRGL